MVLLSIKNQNFLLGVKEKILKSQRRCLSTIYKMSGCSLSVYKDTNASHDYLCTQIKNEHKFCKLLLKRTQIVVQ